MTLGIILDKPPSNGAKPLTEKLVPGIEVTIIKRSDFDAQVREEHKLGIMLDLLTDGLDGRLEGAHEVVMTEHGTTDNYKIPQEPEPQYARYG